ncbi:hypothetical protein COU05_01980 [bacterium (Candidatus Gribaldobacteria) CG10_big_fil_rev_8_21_14_0_10_37_21]|uniref:Alpha-2-macroglobulin domain-containing protein n=1 Tax=bacterium (Candidatus Gribaldobacteria) CG10_big_fil_rev_8_21_14_0_10_37_21 TaxID=2014275 RepID=A0A2H0UW82_9BACT|nr:MAG: hypothetical protein COU05_01980 [bacterium (Candidatus Gribaldobacteria) CG10_big_fil_rev_8_21_14_0_10_37_21]
MLNQNELAPQFYVKESKRGMILKALLALVLLIVAGGAVFFILQNKENVSVVEKYDEPWRLVPEKVSRSGYLKINLPQGVGASKEAISFEPKIEGSWQNRGISLVPQAKAADNFLFFKPDSPLELNRHYSVILALDEKTELKADFLSVEDPKISNIFPLENSEAPEESKITITFNRPMVPLTTLSQVEQRDIPVEITPQTAGKFRWLSTNVLQFEPKERLLRSWDYTVKVKAGFASEDGLKIEAKTISFQTRKLRYNLEESFSSGGSLVYSQPLIISFNQPVNLEKTKSKISLFDKTKNQKKDFILKYTQREVLEDSSQIKSGDSFSFLPNFLQAFIGIGENKMVEDKTSLAVYLTQDQFKRKEIWDTEIKYELNITGAFPEEGNINLSEQKKISFSTSGLIKDWQSKSQRTNYTGIDLFDPQGEIQVSFFEEIDLGKSSFKIPSTGKATYAKKCAGGYFSTNCPKEDDKTILIFKFDQAEFQVGETFKIIFEKIVNQDGLQINPNQIVKEIKVYQAPKIYSAFLKDLTSMEVCSNNPLFGFEKAELKEKIICNLDCELFSMETSQETSQKIKERLSNCSIGQFSTIIKAGFMPEKNYQIELKLKDSFNQDVSFSLKALSGEMEAENVSIFSLQETYNLTTPDKTKLSFAVRNINYVNVSVCKVSALSLYESYFNNEQGLACLETKNFKLDLSDRYWINNYFQIDLKDYFSQALGNYVLTLSHPAYLNWDKSLAILKTYVSVTNLAIAEKRINLYSGLARPDYQKLTTSQVSDLSNLYWVTDIKTQEPIKGAFVDLYANGIFKERAITNESGIAFSSPQAGLDAVVVNFGEESTPIFGWRNQLNYSSQANNVSKFYLYSDKPLYQPSQTVNLKGIVRVGYDGNYQIFDKEYLLEVFSPKNEVILSKQVSLNALGTFNEEFKIPTQAPLGAWRACLAGSYSCYYFYLQEYVPAAFEVKATSQKEEYISKEDVNIAVLGNYYFGVPVEQGKMEYTLSAQNYYFDKYQGEYYSFGCFSDDYYDYRRYYYGDKFLSRGNGFLNQDGIGEINFNSDLKVLLNQEDCFTSKIIKSDITVKNDQGRSVSAQNSVIVHAGEFYLGVKTTPWGQEKGKPLTVKVKAVDTAGKEKQVKGGEVEIYKVSWDCSKRQEGGSNYSYSCEKNRIESKKFNFSTNAEGDYQNEIALSEAGHYEIDASAKDSKGNLVKSRTSFYIFGQGQVSILPTTDTTLNLRVQKTALSPNEEGNLVIESPFEKAKALITIERGEVSKYQIVEIRGNLYNYTFEAKEEYAPNFFVSVLLQSPEGEVKFGQTEFTVNSEAKKISVDIGANKKYYSPGEDITLEILAKDNLGNPVQGEFSLAVVDLSVLALKGNPKKDPFVFFYDGFPLTVRTYSNLKAVLEQLDIAESPTKGGGGSLDKDGKARGEFKETAFWQGDIKTDTTGKAVISFKLPDNLTTWQAEALGITSDTKVGVAYTQFKTQKDLMITPLKPRFILPGDFFEIGAQVFNQSAKSQKIKVKLEVKGLELVNQSREQTISLDTGKNKTVFFKVKLPVDFQGNWAEFLISAQGAGIEDIVLGAIEVKPNLTYETTALSSYTTAENIFETIYLPQNISQEKGEIEVGVSATLAVFMTNALNDLLGFPYGCSEQISSKLKSIAVIKLGLKVPNLADKFNLKPIIYNNQEYTLDEVIKIGLSEVYNLQNFDGGFSFWPGGQSNISATLAVLDMFNALKKIGQPLNQNSFNQAVSYLLQELNKNLSSEQIISYSLVLLEAAPEKSADLVQKLNQIIANQSILNDKLSSKALAQLGVIVNSYSGLNIISVNNLLDNRINIDSRGAFLEKNKNQGFFYENTVSNTALYLRALALSKRDNSLLDRTVRWLFASRQKDGSFGSTQNNLEVIQAFVEFLKWKKETEAEFEVKVKLNEKEILSYGFNQETILDQVRKVIPIQELKPAAYNYLEFSKANQSGLYYDIAFKYYLSGRVAPRDEGFTIERNFFALSDKKNESPLANLKVGEVIREHLQIIVPQESSFVFIEDYIPAGVEIVDLSLSTESKQLNFTDREVKYFEIQPDFKEIRNDKAFISAGTLQKGVYEFDYFVRPLIKGTFLRLPAVVAEMYRPENFGRTSSEHITIE